MAHPSAPAPPNPAILTVDDDPSVSRAVARDVRREYGDRFRVVRASSGAEALAALNEIKLRGEQVALLLADYRMPQMNGIEFLEQAMDVFPTARRVLLTAYADTGAAIDAINVVDLDHYLLKPWHPPEEKLYPVLDSLLDLWQTSTAVTVPEVRIVGHRWSAPSYAARDFLARNLVPHRWLPADDAEAQRLLAAAGVSEADLPLVVTTDGKTLVSPSEQDLAANVGLSVAPANEFYDLVVVGAGPAGLGAAVYAASEGLRTVLVERHATGGQAGQSNRIENYLGFPDGVSGAQLTDRARRQALRFGAELLTTRDVVGLSTAGTTRLVHFGDGSTIAAYAVVLATGVSYRRLAAPGLEELTNRGVYYGSAATEALACTGQEVFIVGGANSAGQAAMYFARYARRVQPAHPGRRSRPVDVALPHRPDRGPREDHRPSVHRDRGRRRRRPSGPADAARRPLGRDPHGRRVMGVRLHRGRATHRVARGAGRPGRPGVRADRDRPAHRGSPAGRLGSGP